MFDSPAWGVSTVFKSTPEKEVSAQTAFVAKTVHDCVIERMRGLLMPKIRITSPDRVYGFARGMRKAGTFTEKLLWTKLRRRALHGFRFRRQAPMGRYIADFVSADGGVVVEVDGSSHVGRRECDRIRDDWFRSMGFEVLRVSVRDVEDNMPWVLERIGQACHRSATRSKSTVPAFKAEAPVE